MFSLFSLCPFLQDNIRALSRSTVEQLALLIAHIRETGPLVNALARFALQIQNNRRHWFRQLSTEANKRALAAKLDVVQICVDPIWI